MSLRDSIADETGYKIGKVNPSPISQKPGKTLDLQPSKSLATGLKRIGGRAGTTRLGVASRRGRPLVTHKF